MIPGSQTIAGSPGISPLDGFTGGIARTKISPLYSMGLGVVAFAMILLPLLYMALIVLAAWGVWLHLTRDTWIFSGSGGALFRGIAYIGPAIAGVVLVFFMVKPFFARKAKAPEPVTLDPQKEPVLFAFVRKICELVGAPMPSRIDADCQVNASASLRRGLWSRDLVLTIGLPLAAGLDLRQFAGVLAHEFGHFAQGAGMRFTYIIRRTNFWFARVVYERDDWDRKLEESARNADWRIGIVLHISRGCVWLTRRILWALMQAGHAISCFMLRQMEYDADSYEAKIAGSDAFEATASRLRVLNVATQTAYEDVRQSWASNRLPENLPLLIDHKAGSLPTELHHKLETSQESEKTGWFDTHPCDKDRNQAARRLNEPGVFQLTQPATTLFSDFAQLSRTVTRHHYEKHLELEFTDQNLMPAEEILRESAASSQADALVRKFYGTLNPSLKPLILVEDLPSLTQPADAKGSSDWQAAREKIEALRGDAEKISSECLEQYQRQNHLTTGHILANAGFKLEPAAFKLPANATSPGEQEIAARFALEETSATLADRLTKLEPFAAALRQCAAIALRSSNTSNRKDDSLELAELARLAAAVGAEMPRLRLVNSKLKGFELLAQNLSTAQSNQAFEALQKELELLIKGMQERLHEFKYPFSHARGELTVAEYARSEKTVDNEALRVFLNGHRDVERLSALNYRLVGRLLTYVDAADTQMQKAAGQA